MQSTTNVIADFTALSVYGLVMTPQADEKSSGICFGFEVVKITVACVSSLRRRATVVPVMPSLR